jgi:hypothetical protein
MKNFNETIGNQTRDLPAYSAVPQTTALPRAPGKSNKDLKNCKKESISQKRQSFLSSQTPRNVRGCAQTAPRLFPQGKVPGA